MLGGVAALLRLNEQGEGWATAHIAGHTVTPLVQTLTAGEAITLSSYGLKTVADLFPPHELRPGLNKNADIIYPSILQQNYPGLVARCKNLRSKLAHRTGQIQNTQMTFFEVVKDIKLSKLYRSLKLQQEDSLWPGPPSYFTRRKDGYSLPPLHVYMAGYKTCMSLDMPSKTKEIAFNTLNRQIWTNQKGHWMANNRGEEYSSKCALCDKTENTMHLLFECEKYSELLWFHMSVLLQQQFNKNNIVIHAYNVMYCVTNIFVPHTHRSNVQILIEETKRDIIRRHFLRLQNPSLARVRYNKQKILAHIILTCNKIILSRNLLKKHTKFFKDISQLCIDQL